MKATFTLTVATVLAAFVSASPPPKCPEHNGEFVTLLPDPDNCRTYYSCNEGIPFLMECYGDLLFNAEKSVCDWPEDVVCGHRPILPKPTIQPSTTKPTAGPISSTIPTGKPSSPVFEERLHHDSSSRPPKPPHSTHSPKPPHSTHPPKPTHPTHPPKPSTLPPTSPSAPEQTTV